MKFTYVLARKLMYMRSTKLTDGIAVHAMYVLPTDKAYGIPLRIINVICHFNAS